MSTKLTKLIALFEQLETWDAQGRRSVSAAPVFDAQPHSDDTAIETPLSQTVNHYNELTTQIRDLVDNKRGDDLRKYLSDCLQHTKVVIRLQAAEALGYTRNTHAITALVDAMRQDVDYSVKVAAAQSLGIIGNVMATPYLIEVLDDNILQAAEIKLHWAAAQALSFIGDPNAAEALVDALTHDYGTFEEQASEIREAARDALVSIGGENVVVRLIELWGKSPLHPVEDIDLGIRHEMITAFSQIENTTALDFLLGLARHDHPIIREMVMSVLTYPQDPRIVPILTGALKDSDSYVRDAAEFSLQRLGKY
jgi:HEAT repeat protein